MSTGAQRAGTCSVTPGSIGGNPLQLTTSADAEDALAVGVAVGEPLDGGAELGHLVLGGDVGSYASAGEDLQRGAGAVGEAGGAGLAEQAAVVGQQRGSRHEQVVGGDRDGLEGGDVAVGRESAVRGEPLQAGGPGGSPDGVEDDVEGLLAEGSGELGAGQHLVVAERGGVGGPAGVAGDAGYVAGAGQPGVLDGHRADAAGGGVDQHPVVRLDPGDGVDQVV